MSLNYTLSIAGAHSNDALLEKIQLAKGYSMTTNEIFAPGLRLRFSKPGPVDSQIIEEEFGFSPGVQIDFRVDKMSNPETVAMYLLRGCRALLDQTPGDAVLLFNGETVIFLRQAGRLVLNPVEGFWVDAVKAEVIGPYRLAPISNI